MKSRARAKIPAKASTARDAALVAGFIAGLLIMAIGMAYLNGQIRAPLMPQAQMPAVPAPLTAGIRDSHSGLGALATGSYS